MTLVSVTLLSSQHRAHLCTRQALSLIPNVNYDIGLKATEGGGERKHEDEIKNGRGFQVGESADLKVWFEFQLWHVGSQ